MRFATIGNLVKEIRMAKNITRKELSRGICSEHVLWDLEEDRYMADALLLDIILQRLGQSPDQFEMILSSELYSLVRLRDLIAEAICRGKRSLAEKLLQVCPLRTRVDQMYQHRMKACLIYYIDGDCALAAEYLQRAIMSTMPCFSYTRIGEYLISATELENLMALERMNVEQAFEDSIVRETARQHLKICMDYIEKHFKDGEEYAKLTSKCTWLLGGICYLERDYMQAMVFCKEGMEGLRKNAILYFMIPLLELMVKSEVALGIVPERSRWAQYYQILTFLWGGYAKRWYPTEALFHNCYQRDYHLDHELIRAERLSQNMTQAQLAEKVYQNTESLSRVESGKVSPNRRTFEKMMKKLGIEKNRYNGCVVTDSFEVMELKKSIDGFLMRRDYQNARESTIRLKNILDMDVSENKLVIRLYEIVTAKRLGEMTVGEALEGLKILSKRFMDLDKKVFYHIPMRNEVLVINNICITLCETGHGEEAMELYRLTLEKIRSSKVKVKYRYRSYQILLNNYVHECGNMEEALEELQNEFLCGKAMELSFCVNNILQILFKNGVPADECDEWIKAVYYIFDLYLFEKDKNIYKDFLAKNRNIKVID